RTSRSSESIGGLYSRWAVPGRGRSPAGCPRHRQAQSGNISVINSQGSPGDAMFSLQTIFGKGDKFYGLLEASAEAARESARAMHELVTQTDRTPVMAAFSTARAREKALHGQIGEELVNT